MRKLLMILTLVFLFGFTFGCLDKEAMAELEAMRAQAALEEQNKTLIKQYYDAFLNGDLETLREILSPDFVWHTGFEPDFSLE